MLNRTTRLSNLLDRNVAAVAKVEAALLGERSRGARLIRWLIRRVGTPWSAVLHSAALLGWVAWNSGLEPQEWGFDPPPFPMLQLIASIEAILLGILILASQNRLEEEADQRSHLNLQVNLLVETETTRMLHMLDQICQRFGIEGASAEELDELKSDTNPEKIVETLRSTMPNDRQ